jgi:O-antigen/teichoic acid export membrane protein
MSFRNGALSLLRFAGIDRAVGYVVMSRGLGVVAAPVTFILIAMFLSPKEQGYYYTFASLLGLTLFLDLGLTNVLMLFSSHEKASLEWGPMGTLTGAREAQARLAGIFRLGRRWFGMAAVIILLVLFPAGLMFFNSQDPVSQVSWVLPWLAAVAVTSVSLLIAPVTTMIEGCGKVKEMRMLGFLQPLLSYPVMWTVLILGGGLFAGPAFFGSGLIVTLVWLSTRYPRFMTGRFAETPTGTSFSWREIWPLQWRTALECLGGYLVFQLFTPMLFAMQSAEVAGRMGMSLSLTQTIGGLGLAWVTTKIPRMGMLWARKDHAALDRLFFGALWRMVAVTIAGLSVVWAAIMFLGWIHHPYAIRVLDPLSLALVMAVQPLNNVMFSEAAYVRGNKHAPFVWIALGYGAMTAILNWTLGSLMGALGMAIGYLAAGIVSCFAYTLVFLRYRRRWQN